jgi:hypothetical protein
MSEDRLKYIEVIGEGPSANAAGEEEEAEVRLTGVLQVAEIWEDGGLGRADRVRFRVRFGIEPAEVTGGRAGFRTTD